MFRVPLKIYGAVMSMKKLNVIKQNEKKNSDFFCQNIPPHAI